ncbi:MAG: D-aminoacylase [Thermoplasmatales archaeon]
MVYVKGGLLVDGTGTLPTRNPGLIIKRDKIYFANSKQVENDEITIDADGFIIAPGFIDAHSHSDVKIIKNPSAENRILQGITTEITGNCGFTPFPVTSKNEDSLREEMEIDGVELNWKNFREYATIVNKNRPAINIASLVGHGTLRSAVMGEVARKPTKEEMDEMKRLLEKNLKEGAFGLSSGLEYVPSGFADVEELSELCKVVAKMGRVYATHMRDEGDFLGKSIDESLAVSRKSGAKLEISHLKSVKRANWGKGIKELTRLEKLAKKGEKIGWDAYPYNASSTSLTITIPKKLMDGGFGTMLERIKDQKERNEAKKEMKKKRNEEDWRGIVVEDIQEPEISKYNHSNILDISRDMNESCEETVFKLLEKNQKDITIIAHTMNDLDVDVIMSHPLTAIGSDSSVYVKGTVHPRAFGTFPRVFKKYVKELNYCTVQGMVQKASSLSADRFGIESRGYIRDGYYADIVIFDPNTYEDKNTFEFPTTFPNGVEYLFVNGIMEVSGRKITGERGGMTLKK